MEETVHPKYAQSLPCSPRTLLNGGLLMFSHRDMLEWEILREELWTGKQMHKQLLGPGIKPGTH